ncbi:uncharacterized protein LOC110014220 [Oryzias latipes]|uniref:uncharacterized protein LOC110014220 n=1 Tax=Oryzias latipes TaxID=8090 RepID=UPI000CE1DC06|nr:uncharacterized protein LOC110014220 [Oryzias latipes]
MLKPDERTESNTEHAAEPEPADVATEQHEEPRRSERARTLTERGKVFQRERLEGLMLRFDTIYERWKALTKLAKKSVMRQDPNDILQEHISSVEKELLTLNSVYDEYRCTDSPPHDMRHKLDKAVSVTKIVIKNAQSQTRGEREEIVWPDASSVFASSSSSVSLPVSDHSKRTLSHSVASALSRQEAAAEYAATRAVLQIMAEQECRREELEKLEAENKLITADQETAAYTRRLEREREETERKIMKEKQEAALLRRQQEENVERKRSVENLKREVERLEELKRLHAAKARLKVYDENEFHPTQAVPACPEVTHLDQGVRKQSVNQYADTAPSSKGDSQKDTVELVKVLAEALSANRLPIPEPTIFSGDALKFSHWKSSFQTLIERKNIPAAEKMFFLQKYVGGAARESLEGFFLTGSEASYEKAWNLLNERYGEPFVIAKAFRDKLHAWPKIAHRESSDLRKFVDFLRSCESAMVENENLNVLNDAIENQKMAAKLPDWLSTAWNRKATEYQLEHRRFPKFGYFVTFLTMEANIACNPITSYTALHQDQSDKSKIKPQNFVSSKGQTIGTKSFTTNVSERKTDTCGFCKKVGHLLHNCRNLIRKPIAERVKFIQSEKLCFGCLNPGHYSKYCKSRMTCSFCSKRHPSCLHEERPKQEQQLPSEQAKETVEVKEKRSLFTVQPQETDVFKETTSNRVVNEKSSTQTSTIVPVYVSTQSDPTKEVLTYALLDSQSDSSFILDEVVAGLDVNSERVKLKLSTMSSRATIVPCERIQGLQIRGLSCSKRITVPVVYTREFIPANHKHIPTPETAKAWPHLEHLAEYISPQRECDIGLLIGYNCPQALLPREVVCGEESQPYAQKTDLGWSIVSYGDPSEIRSDAIGVSHRIVVKQVIPETKTTVKLKREVHYVCRTQIKEIATPDEVLKMLESDFSERVEEAAFSQEDLDFLSKLRNGIKHKSDGHFEMPLPFKQDRPNLPNNMQYVAQRLMSLKRRLLRDETYYADYVSFMDDIVAKGDAERVPAEELDNHPAWYIPHHGVYHPHKPGKIRVVFDCSARYQDKALNDYLLTGPELTNTLVGVLCRFRKGPVAVMCDVERMFHQFHVKPEDRDYLRFLWWESSDLNSPPSVFRMKVHLFGAASSPGCANFGLKHLASESEGKFNSSTVQFIQRNFYVDDGLVSVASEVAAVELVREARELCSGGKLRLYKFISNSEEVLKSIPKEDCADSVKDLDLASRHPIVERALGVQWCVSSDNFQFRVTIKEHPLTRRGVLSTVASIYDPLGFVAPFVLRGKQILQQLCQDKVGWDHPMPEELKSQWEFWLRDLQKLVNIKTRRCFIPENFTDVQQYELHHFSDASVTGYGICTYLRVVDNCGKVHCSLVLGKARVTPTKVTTVPRLELSAAVVAAKTSFMLRKELEINDLKEHFWTDSRIVLGYINNDAKRFHVFVANRVQKIKSTSEPEQWRFVQSKDNPADHASRGLTADQLTASNWFRGPDFLWERNLPVPDAKVGEIDDSDPELRKVQVLNVKAEEQRTLLDRLTKFSDWKRAVKAIACLKKFANQINGAKPKPKVYEASSIEERKEAETFIFRLAQEEAFNREINSIKRCNEIKPKDKASQLYKLSPFLDEHGVLRVGGRLTRSCLHPHIKHPVILPKASHVSSLLIKHYHEKVHHQGRGITHNELRSNGIWIIGCSRVVSSHIYKCIVCRKYRRNTQDPKMSDLPEDRMEMSPPFTYCGMDCFGPFYVRDARKELKKYGLLFTCMSSRAVHIELLDDLTTDAFINALRAFIAIRGKVRQLRCDQGTNFVGANKEFMNAMKGLNEEQLKEHGCEFIMNVPSASHMGGVWERQIRTIRSVLTAILDQSSKRLDSSSLRTFLYEVMAIINSRPLSTDHLNDPSFEPLTPNHILMMKSSIISPPPGDFVSQDLYLRKRWRQVQYLANVFWTRWKKEYLLNLQQRQTWQKDKRDTKVNDIVILQEDNSPRCRWKLAKVTEVYPSADGRVRKVKLLLSNSTLDDTGKRSAKPVYLDRPVQKTVLLLEAQ